MNVFQKNKLSSVILQQTISLEKPSSKNPGGLFAQNREEQKEKTKKWFSLFAFQNSI